jgi:hypothetical protein
MLKIILPAAVLASICLVVSDSASAGWRRRSACCVPAPAVVVAPAPATTYYPATPAPVAVAPSRNPPIASAPSAPAYRSYSYDSATVNNGTYVVPAQPYAQPLPPSERRFYRADRKAHGLSWYQNRW